MAYRAVKVVSPGGAVGRGRESTWVVLEESLPGRPVRRVVLKYVDRPEWFGQPWRLDPGAGGETRAEEAPEILDELKPIVRAAVERHLARDAAVAPGTRVPGPGLLVS